MGNLGLGQMGSLGLESVLIGNVVHGVGLAIGSDVVVGSTDDDGSALRSEGLQLSLLGLGHTIAGLEGEFVAINSDVVVLVTEHLGVLGVIDGGGNSQGQDGGEDNDQFHVDGVGLALVTT